MTALRNTGTLRRLALAAAVAGASAAVALVVTTAHSEAAMSHQQSLSPKAAAFTRAMDKLWEDHITWTRMVIVDFAADLPDLKQAEVRLLRNQADIGNAIKPYYGAAAGNKLTTLLRTHILEAVPVLTYAKEGNHAKLQKALKAWYANAHQVAVFLSKANPQAWPLSEMNTMMKRHLALTTDEGVARIQGHWKADIAAYDKVHLEILQMSQMLSSGIISQFPSRF
jgi:hypothetical protein